MELKSRTVLRSFISIFGNFLLLCGLNASSQKINQTPSILQMYGNESRMKWFECGGQRSLHPHVPWSQYPNTLKNVLQFSLYKKCTQTFRADLYLSQSLRNPPPSSQPDCLFIVWGINCLCLLSHCIETGCFWFKQLHDGSNHLEEVQTIQRPDLRRTLLIEKHLEMMMEVPLSGSVVKWKCVCAFRVATATDREHQRTSCLSLRALTQASLRDNLQRFSIWEAQS